MERVSAKRTGPRFLIADDHALFAEALRVYLEKTYPVVGIVHDGRAMVAEAMRVQPDVILVDVGMPLLNGPVEPAAFTRSYREYSRFSVSILHLLARRMGRAAIKL